ncbi:hypothetical protein DXG01_013773 [Tephrocybe rancida]|nr:hypothetical protein DXG01_013773 [Tephrocybe rancida]
MKTTILISTILATLALAAPEAKFYGRAPSKAVINGYGGTLVDGAKVHYDANGVPSVVYTTHTPSEWQN